MAFTDALTYLAHYRALASGQQDGPFVSATFTSVQHSTGARNPGITSYGFNPIGSGYGYAGGPNNGLAFPHTRMHYSDRNGFADNAVDVIDFVVIPNGAETNVQLGFSNETWGGSASIGPGQLEVTTQQLLFPGAPGAGPGAPHSLFIVSFQDRTAR